MDIIDKDITILKKFYSFTLDLYYFEVYQNKKKVFIYTLPSDFIINSDWRIIRKAIADKKFYSSSEFTENVKKFVILNGIFKLSIIFIHQKLYFK